MKKLIFICVAFVVVIMILSGCSSSPEQVATMTALAWTSTPLQTTTPIPSLTFSPTQSPTITLTALPTLTPTPVVLSISQKPGDASGDIFVLLEDSNTEINITENIAGRKIILGCSPNMEWILYVRYDPSSSAPWETWIMKSTGSEKYQFDTLIGPTVSWSADSEHFIANCVIDGNPQAICLVHLNGLNLTSTGFTGYNPIFSPDGNSYIWQGEVGNSHGVPLNMFDERTKQEKQIAIFDLMGSFSPPIWSADNLGVYICNSFLPGDQSKIYYLKIDRSEKQVVATIDRLVSSMVISPKGDHLLLFTDTSRISDVYGVIKTDGTGLFWLQGYRTMKWQEDDLLIGTKSDETQYIIDPETGKATLK